MTPLVDDAGVPIAVLDPRPRLTRGHAYVLLTGPLLLFPTENRRSLFEKSTKNVGQQNVAGFKTDVIKRRT